MVNYFKFELQFPFNNNIELFDFNEDQRFKKKYIYLVMVKSFKFEDKFLFNNSRYRNV